MKFYLYLDKERNYWAYLTSNPNELDEEDFEYGIYLYATVTNIQELWKAMEKANFDGEYINYFLQDLDHYDYNMLAGIDK